jgi:hypothetical protein
VVLRAWSDGWRRVARARGMALALHGLTFLLALPLALMLRDQIAAQLGTSVMGGMVADGVSYDWWTEFSAQAAGLGATFTPSIIGFGATLDAISRVLDARYPPTSLLWLLGAYLALWTFLSGGIIDRYARQRRTYAHGFFGAAGRLFFRVARLAAAAGLIYWLLFRFVHPWLFLDLYRDLTRGLGVEQTSLLWRLLFYALFGGALLAVNLVFDYARIRLVVEDRRSALGALLASLRFVRRHPFAVAGLCTLNALGFLLLLAAWWLAAPRIHGAGPAMWAAFVAGQLYLLARLAIKLHFLSSQTALFQAHLAHAAYTAAPAAAWPESPAADAIAR